MDRPSIILVLSLSLGCLQATAAETQPTKCPTPSVPETPGLSAAGAPPKSADLSSVISTVEAALKCYQDNIGSGQDALPPLLQADFDFKTTTAKTGGLTISFFIFKLGATREKDVTNDITFTYKVPPPPKPIKGVGFTGKNHGPTPLSDAIVADLQGVAAALKTSSQAAGLPFLQTKIAIQFGVVNDGNVTISAPVQLVTLGPNVDYKKSVGSKRNADVGEEFSLKRGASVLAQAMPRSSLKMRSCVNTKWLSMR
jgi:hypothetical protein